MHLNCAGRPMSASSEPTRRQQDAKNLRCRDGSTEAAAAFRRVQEAADRLLKAVRTFHTLAGIVTAALLS